MAINPLITHGETFGRIVYNEDDDRPAPVYRNSNAAADDDAPAVILTSSKFEISRRSPTAFRALRAQS